MKLSIKNHVIYPLIIGLGVLTVFFSILHFAHADFSQSNFAQTDSTGHAVYQVLGTSLSGTITSINLHMHDNTSGNLPISIVQATTDTLLRTDLHNTASGYYDFQVSGSQGDLSSSIFSLVSSLRINTTSDGKVYTLSVCNGHIIGNNDDAVAYCTGLTLNPSYYYGFWGDWSGPSASVSGSSSNLWRTSSENVCWNDGGSYTTDSCASGVNSNILTDLYFQFLGGIDDTELPPPPTLEFKYPTSGLTTPLFSPFLLKATNLIANDNYIAKIQWYVTTQVGTSTVLESSRRNNLTYGLGSSLLANGIKIPRTDFGYDLATTTDLYASAQLYDTQDPSNPLADTAFPVMVASTTVQAILQNIPASNGDFIIPSFNSSSTITTSTVPVASQELSGTNQPLNASGCDPLASFNPFSSLDFIGSSSQSDHFDPSCAFINGVNSFIYSLGQFGSGTWDNVISLVKQVFPINLYTGIDEMFQGINVDSSISTEGSSTISSTYLTDLNFPTSTTSRLSHPNVPVFPSLGNTILKYFDYKSFMDKVAYALTGLIMLIVGIMLIAHFHKTSTEQ